MNKIKYLTLGLLLSMGVCNAEVKEFTGAGATFPYPIYSKWAASYEKATSNKLNYQSIGSGAGIKQIQASTVDFGASDKPLDSKELEKHNLFQFPAVMGGVVLGYNIKGVATNTLKLDGQVLGDIFLGKIKKWNDPAIQKLNPDVKLPDQTITAVHRSDGSGTTFLFTTYLSQVNKEWKDKVGAETSVSWPTGIGGKGNEGVAGFVKQTPGSIGYVEYAYALENKIPTTQLQNHDGNFVKPSIEAFKAAGAKADWEKTKDFHLILTNQPGKDSWPIAGATFILVHKKSKNPKATLATVKFYNWAFKNGDKMAEELAYVPLPSNLKDMIRKAWETNLTDEQGKTVCTENVCK